MAIALYFRRITGPDTTDQDARATYEYGPDPDHTPHRVVIDLVAGTTTAAGGTPGDHDGRVAGKVMVMRRESGRWPEQGSRFS